MADDFKTVHSSPTYNGNGRPHAFTKKGREFAQRLVESEQYRKWIHDRIAARTLDASIERMLWAYAYGKPKEYIELSTSRFNLGEADVDMLRIRAERLAGLLSQLNAAQTREEADRLLALLAQEEEPPAVH